MEEGLNLFYESFPEKVRIENKDVRIITDFREYIKLIDMLNDKDMDKTQKLFIISEYFVDRIPVTKEAVTALTSFVMMEAMNMNSQGERPEENGTSKKLYSFRWDYPYILSGFLRDYKIDLMTIRYMHWWKFRMLFDGLSDDTEIKQRIMYRGIDAGTIKDKDERKRIRKIQAAIALPQDKLTDYDIGNIFA